MINDLRYAITFPTNGVSLSGELSFQPGATAITGDNGIGKSFIAEMIRYGMFGKKALRGPASDYKTLDMAESFTVAGTKYHVVRGKKELLYDKEGGEPIAIGADAVNKKIVEILGFDLEVFDVICAANQKESERLTRLTPARRKELIDDVVGLTAQETVEKACREEAKTARVEAETLTRMLVLPVEPVKPEGYRPSAGIKAELQETQQLIEQRAALQRIIDAVPSEPKHPGGSECDVATIEAHEQERVRREAQRAALERQIAAIPEPKYTLEEIEQAEALGAYDAEVKRRGERPTIDITTFELKEMLDIWDEIDALKRLDRVDVTCPKCRHEFCPSQELPDEPEYTRRQINADIEARRIWAEHLVEPEGQRLSPQEKVSGRTALARAGEKVNLQHELDELEMLPDMSAELAFARETNQKLAIYASQLDHYTACAVEAANAEEALSDLPTPKHSLEELNAVYTATRIYEERLTDYTMAKDRFDELTAEIGEKQERADAFMAGAKGLVEARRTLKAFLAPSLSRVASKLISDMTENSLRPLETIYVDEDMNITADGQDVSTFNGAHATMINLALRLALGQVLVARVFPVFIGDEIDSDATPANSQAIADGLMACKEQLKQIVLISHKRLENVDHEVML